MPAAIKVIKNNELVSIGRNKEWQNLMATVVDSLQRFKHGLRMRTVVEMKKSV
jgi:hypothetical protein